MAELAATSPRVAPLRVRCGAPWDDAEEGSAGRLLAALARPSLLPLRAFELPLGAVYGDHWGVTGDAVPDSDSPADAVYLPGRNLLLVPQAAVWCRLNGFPTLALGVLKGNPFADASAPFFDAYQRALKLGLGGDLLLARPFAGLGKEEVLRRGGRLPLGLTWSCLRPAGGAHCGRCNKCSERRKAFAAGVADPTAYAGAGRMKQTRRAPRARSDGWGRPHGEGRGAAAPDTPPRARAGRRGRRSRDRAGKVAAQPGLLAPRLEDASRRRASRGLSWPRLSRFPASSSASNILLTCSFNTGKGSAPRAWTAGPWSSCPERPAHHQRTDR
jgi:7-cyano-7-deazaguanine synthase